MAKRSIGLILGLLLALAPVRSDAVAPAHPADDVLRATLSNGLRVVVVPDRLAPVVTTELNYLVGSNDAPEGFPGTAHALEHMMFRGSDGLDKDQLAELGALLGGNYNASTTETVTQYTFTVPADNLGLALSIEASRMRGLTLSEADWDKERGAIEQEVSRDLSSPFYNFMRQAQAILFQQTPYEHDALGDRPSFDKTDAGLLRRFYETWYVPNNAILVIAGDVNPHEALALAEAAFGNIDGHALPPHAPTADHPVQPRTLRLDTNFSIGLVGIAYRMPGLKSGDFAAADILSDVLASERASLYGLVPAGKALTARFSYQAKADVGFGLAMAAFPSGGDPEPVLANVRRVLADFARDGVPADLIEAARQQELAQLAFGNNSISGLASSWSHALAFAGAESPRDVARAYQAVSVDDVNRLARVLLDPDHAVTAVLLPRAAGRPATEGAFGGPESFAVPPDHPVTLPAWAASALAKPYLPPPGDPPDVSVLPNGIQLVIQPEHVSRTVSIYGRIRQVPAMQEPPGQEGVAAVTRAMFDYGTAVHDRMAFREAIDGIAAQLRGGPSFSLQVLTPAFPDGLRLLAENMLQPAFPAAAFSILRGQIAQSVAGQAQTPNYLFHRAIQRAVLPNGDPMLREPTPESIMALRLEDVRAFYHAAFRPDLTTIVVVGDVGVEEAKAAIIGAFGDWRTEGPTPVIDPPPVPENRSSQIRIPDGSALQDSVTLTEMMMLPVSSPDRLALILGNTILGAGFSSHLYQDLRVRSGYVYSVGSQPDWSRTRGDYSVTFGADGANVERARQLVLRNLRDMQNHPVSDAELTRAKAELLRRLPMRRASVGGIAGQYLQLMELGLPVTSPRTAAARYLAVTAEEVQQAFVKWIRPDDLVEVVKGPAE